MKKREVVAPYAASAKVQRLTNVLETLCYCVTVALAVSAVAYLLFQ